MKTNKMMLIAMFFSSCAEFFYSRSDTLINYSPLSIGNKYQFSGEGYTCFDFFQTSITKDTVIEGETYYYLNRWQMIDSTGKLWIRSGGQKVLWMDFSLEPGQTLNGKTINAGVSNLFGYTVPWKGYSVSSVSQGESIRWGYGLGQMYNYSRITGPFGLLIRQESLIQMISNDSVILSHWYYPVILFIEPDTLTNFNLSITAEVKHVYTRSPSCIHEQYIDYLQFQSLYKHHDSIISNDNITRPSDPSSTLYTINYLIDSNLVKQGFKFFYRLVAKDKGISPHYTIIPETGYFEIFFAGLTNLNEEERPYKFNLYQNYPNPFNPVTKIRYTIPSAVSPLLGGARGGLVTLKVYDILGNEITTLVNEERQPGDDEIEFDAAKFNLSSGVYFYQVRAGSFVETKKMMLLW